jgi:hypothetical protein
MSCQKSLVLGAFWILAFRTSDGRLLIYFLRRRRRPTMFANNDKNSQDFKRQMFKYIEGGSCFSNYADLPVFTCAAPQNP